MRGLFFSVFILVPFFSSSPSWGMEEGPSKGSPKKRLGERYSLQKEREEKVRAANPKLFEALFGEEETPPSPAKQPRLAAHLLPPPSPRPGPSSQSGPFKVWRAFTPSPQPSPQGGDADRASVASSLSSEEAALPFEGRDIMGSPSLLKFVKKKKKEQLSLQDFLSKYVLTNSNMEDFKNKVAVPAFKEAPNIMKKFKEDLQDLKENFSNGNTEYARIFTSKFFNCYPLVRFFIKDYFKPKLVVTKKEFFPCKWDTKVGNFLTGFHMQMVTKAFDPEELERFLIQALQAL